LYRRALLIIFIIFELHFILFKELHIHSYKSRNNSITLFCRSPKGTRKIRHIRKESHV